MRDVHMDIVRIDDVDSYMDRFRVGKDIQEERSVSDDGTIVYDITVDGLKQRVTFSES